jgi:2,5-dioxopentanoate dehydrogenase
MHGKNFIGSTLSNEGIETFVAFNPTTKLPLKPSFAVATESEIDSAVKLAAQATSCRMSPEQRSAFLNAIAYNIMEWGDDLLTIAHNETALPLPRLVSERQRTVNQLRMFSDLVQDGSWVDARIDTAQPDRQPLPRPDLRRMLTPIGPVAVFGASNFPFAYSVAGNDTSSAFAAGCPVIVKAHPAHPGTSETVATAVIEAAKFAGMPNGIFSMLHGEASVGMALIKHSDLAAAGFTGSLGAGRALCDAAATRPNPIPVHAEMGSVNPVFLFPEALERNMESIAKGLSNSITLGTGQFCVNPGIVVAVDGPALRKLAELLTQYIAGAQTFPMLTQRINSSYFSGLDRLKAAGARALLEPTIPDSLNSIGALFEVDAATFLSSAALSEEVFGPETLVVSCNSSDQMAEVARQLNGQLTGSIHAEQEDIAKFGTVIQTVVAKVGRVIFNGYPTTVEVVPSMQHGGPYPASSDSRFTSVGTAAIYRFTRPVCWQNAPDELLPLELQNSNPLGITRLVDGQASRNEVSVH